MHSCDPFTNCFNLVLCVLLRLSRSSLTLPLESCLFRKPANAWFHCNSHTIDSASLIQTFTIHDSLAIDAEPFDLHKLDIRYTHLDLRFMLIHVLAQCHFHDHSFDWSLPDLTLPSLNRVSLVSYRIVGCENFCSRRGVILTILYPIFRNPVYPCGRSVAPITDLRCRSALSRYHYRSMSAPTAKTTKLSAVKIPYAETEFTIVILSFGITRPKLRIQNFGILVPLYSTGARTFIQSKSAHCLVTTTDGNCPDKRDLAGLLKSSK